MATDKKPMGEGMVKHAGGGWGYEPNLPATCTERTSNDDDGDESDPEAPPA